MDSAAPSCRPGFATTRPAHEPYGWALKRQIDLLLGSVLLALAVPMILLAGLLIRLTSRGPIIYRQTRVGIDGREFDLFKLRTMFEDAERSTGPVWASTDDPRVTAVGRILRKFRIDELPQLVNVLHGEMSLVGPRPERPEFVSRFERAIPRYARRASVPPGITGLAQVRYGYGASAEDAARKLEYDLAYVESASVALDLQILAQTVRVVLTAAGR